ncbi:MAG: SCO family protein [Pseudomonadota bacterium]|nr:SCO family protein [Pseudomonadota bacterium]
MQRHFLLTGLVIIFAILALIAISLDRSIERPSSQSAMMIKVKFNLLNQNYQPINEVSFRGKHTLIFFGYTYCPDICPTVLHNISESLYLLDKHLKKIQPIFITIDPERDTPKVIKSYLGNFHPLITGLTGKPEQVKKVAKAFGVYFAKAEKDKYLEEDYLVDHSGGIYFLGDDGRFITKFSHSSTPEEIARNIKKYL